LRREKVQQPEIETLPMAINGFVYCLGERENQLKSFERDLNLGSGRKLKVAIHDFINPFSDSSDSLSLPSGELSGNAY